MGQYNTFLKYWEAYWCSNAFWKFCFEITSKIILKTLVLYRESVEVRKKAKMYEGIKEMQALA